MTSSQDFFFLIIRMNLCLPIGFSSLFLVFIDHGQAMAVNHCHLLLCLCRVIFHLHLPEFPRKQPSSCTWFLGMLSLFVRCPSGVEHFPGGCSCFQGFLSMVTAGKPPPPNSSHPRNPEWPFPRITQPVEEVFSGSTEGDAMGVWSCMDKAGRFHPPAVSRFLVLVLSALPW